MGRYWTSGIEMDDLTRSMDTRIGPACCDNSMDRAGL
jgi:hypothetical protein